MSASLAQLVRPLARLLVLVGVLGLSVGEAHADASRIVLVVPGNPRLLARLSAELSGLGFTPVPSDAAVASSPEIEALAAVEHAGASIWIPEGTSVVQIWIADRVTGKTVLRVVDATDETVLALAATELLRASLLEITVSTAHGAEPVTEAVTALAQGPAPRARTSWLALEGGVLAHVDGPTPTGTIGVAFGSALTPWFELASRLDVAPLASVSAHDASATVQLGRV